jgi:hypothetical protein
MDANKNAALPQWNCLIVDMVALRCAVADSLSVAETS